MKPRLHSLRRFAACAATAWVSGGSAANAQYSTGDTQVQLHLDARSRIASATRGQGGLYSGSLFISSRLAPGLKFNYNGVQNNHASAFGVGGRFSSFVTQEATLQKDWKDQQLQVGIIRLPFGLSNFSETYASGLIDYPIARGDYELFGTNWGVPGVRFNGGVPNLRIEAAAFGGQGAGVWGNRNNVSGISLRMQGYSKDFIVGISRWDGTLSPGGNHGARGRTHLNGIDIRYTRPHLLIRGEYLFGLLGDEYQQGTYLDVYYHLPKFHRWTLTLRAENFRANISDPWLNQFTVGFRYTLSREWVAAFNWRFNNGGNYDEGTWTSPTGRMGDALVQVYRKISF